MSNEIMELPIFQVDAFTNVPFKGNPAAVVILDKWLPDKTMQQIAMENNLSETAYLLFDETGFNIRWFTPKSEVDLCGHATLTSAYIIFEKFALTTNKIILHTRKAGDLYITKNNDWIEMDFPSYKPKEIKMPNDLNVALGVEPKSVYQGGFDLLVVYDKEDEILKIKPDFEKLAKISKRGTIVSAKANPNPYNIDFVSRFFAPAVGVNEDPVTGSAHCVLIPYWAKILNKNELIAKQLSSREGILKCVNKGDRVVISGQAVCVLEGTLTI